LSALAFWLGASWLYDLSRVRQWDVWGGLLSGLFLPATVTALIAVLDNPSRSSTMSRLAWIVVLATLTAAPAAAQQGAIPDLRGTWKGQSESIILGAGNPHHAAPPQAEPRLTRVESTMTVDKQDGRRSPARFPRRAATTSSSQRSRATTRFSWSTTMAIRSARSWRQIAWSGATCTFRRPPASYPARS